MKIFKIISASILILITIVFTVNTLAAENYTGTNLDFSIGHGTVTLTNPSAEAVNIQILSTGSRSFRFFSPVEGLSGASVRQGTSGAATQLFEFPLASGVSEFSITGGANPRLIASSSSPLTATAQRLSETEARALLIFATLLTLALVFYISHTMEHPWMRLFARPETSPALPVVPVVESAQGAATRSYGDNRK